jgi:iron complex transport system substrate-binding protein
MDTKYVIAAVVIIVLLVSAAFIIYYQGQAPDEGLQALQSLVDDTDYKTSLTAYPERIVSVAPSCTELLFAIGAGDKVVGVTDYCNYPYNFTAWIAEGNMTSVGNFKDPNMEVITTLDPDLILASGGVQAESVDTLRERGYKVLVLDPTTIDGILNNVELVGNATGKRAEATAFVNDITTRIETVENTVAGATKPKVYYEVYYYATASWTIGGLAWQTEVIENPDVIVLPGEGMGSGTAEGIEAVKARPGWDTTNAVQNDRIYQIDSDIIERSGSRLAEAIEQMAEFFHPELF